MFSYEFPILSSNQTFSTINVPYQKWWIVKFLGLNIKLMPLYSTRIAQRTKQSNYFERCYYIASPAPATYNLISLCLIPFITHQCVNLDVTNCISKTSIYVYIYFYLIIGFRFRVIKYAMVIKEKFWRFNDFEKAQKLRQDIL